jgi:hypothetical protein
LVNKSNYYILSAVVIIRGIRIILASKKKKKIMPHTSKKRSSVGNNAFAPPARRSRRIAGRLNANFDDLDDLLVNILEFLPIKEIMCDRRVSKKWGEVTKMVVPHGGVNYMNNYNAMRVMTTALPNLQQIMLGNLNNQNRRYGIRNKKYSDGEDPDEEWAAKTAEYPTLDIEIISTFRKLRVLTIQDSLYYSSILNGSYPFLFNGFPLLQKLSIEKCKYLKWDLGMLSAFPLLKELHVSLNQRLTGNIRNLRVLKDTLETLTIERCGQNVEGNLMDLADFPHLKELKLCSTAVKGDLRDICDFSGLLHLAITSHSSLTGNIRSLRVLKDTLETLTIATCANVEGNLMDLADFSLLKQLNLYNTSVTGDVRDIGENDFANLEKLRCPFGVVGGYGYEFQRIADVPSVVNALYRLAKRAKSLCEDAYSYYHWKLSDQSPDYYAAHEVEFVEIGTRLGWRWTRGEAYEREYHSCEINWLDPEPDRENDDYDAYAKKLASIQEEITIYKGYHEPPTEEEYRRLCREYMDN